MLLGAMEDYHHHQDRTEAMDTNLLDCRQHRQDRIIQDLQDQDLDRHVDQWDLPSLLHPLDQPHLLACRRQRISYCLYSPAYRRQSIQGDPSCRSLLSRTRARRRKRLAMPTTISSAGTAY